MFAQVEQPLLVPPVLERLPEEQFVLAGNRFDQKGRDCLVPKTLECSDFSGDPEYLKVAETESPAAALDLLFLQVRPGLTAALQEMIAVLQGMIAVRVFVK